MEKGSLGNIIRTQRLCKGYSQETLSEIVGITPTHMKHLESEHRKPSLEVLIKLMETLDFSFDSLVFPNSNDSRRKELLALLSDCPDHELNIITDLILSLKKNRSE